MSQQNVHLIEMQLRHLQLQNEQLHVKTTVNLTSPIPKQKDRILYTVKPSSKHFIEEDSFESEIEYSVLLRSTHRLQYTNS